MEMGDFAVNALAIAFVICLITAPLAISVLAAYGAYIVFNALSEALAVIIAAIVFIVSLILGVLGVFALAALVVD